MAANADAWHSSYLLALAALVLAVPVVLGLMHMLRERETAYGHVGGALGLIGVIGSAGLLAVGFVVWQLVGSGAEAAQVVGLLDRADSA